MKVLEYEQQKDKRLKKSDYNWRDWWDITKQANNHVVGVSEGKWEKKRYTEYLKE